MSTFNYDSIELDINLDRDLIDTINKELDLDRIELSWKNELDWIEFETTLHCRQERLRNFSYAQVA